MSWIAHVKKYQAAHPGMSYKDALSEAGKTYKKKSPSKKVKGKGILSDAWKTVKGVASNVKAGIDGLKAKIFFPPNKLPGGSQKVFNQNADAIIQKITVRREPINSMVNKAINWISMGAFDKAKKELGYDDMFHLQAVLHTNKGDITFEKNERINIAKAGLKSGGDTVEIANIPADLTFDKFFTAGLKAMGDFKFFQYNAFENNCQDFILGVLNANLSLSSEVKSFIKQDSEALLKKQPGYLSRIAQAATDAAGKISQITSGQGKRKVTKRKAKHAKGGKKKK